MSNIISLNLEVKQPDDVKKIAAQATELLNLLNPKGRRVLSLANLRMASISK